MVSQRGFNNSLLSIRVVGWIRGTDIDVFSDKGDIVVSAAVVWLRESIFLRFPIFGIDDEQVRTCVFVLHGPQEVGFRVYLQSIVVAADSHFMKHSSVHGIFDNRAETTGTVRLGIVSVANEDTTVPKRNRVGLVINVGHAGGKY